MIVEKIYQNHENEIIYQLKSGIKIIKRDEDLVEKLNIDKWEELSFIPRDFQEIKRKISEEEEKSLKKFLISQKNGNKGKQAWQKIKNTFFSIFKNKNKH